MIKLSGGGLRMAVVVRDIGYFLGGYEEKMKGVAESLYRLMTFGIFRY